MAGKPAPQLFLPYTANDYNADRFDLTGFPLTINPFRDFDLDV